MHLFHIGCKYNVRPDKGAPKSMKSKTVYVSLIADLLYAGHIRVLEEAAKHGEVTVGLLTQTAINEIGDTAYLKYDQRETVISKSVYGIKMHSADRSKAIKII